MALYHGFSNISSGFSGFYRGFASPLRGRMLMAFALAFEADSDLEATPR
jgi:hypothetical protein